MLCSRSSKTMNAYSEAIEVGSTTRELDPIIDGPESEYDDGESDAALCAYLREVQMTFPDRNLSSQYPE